MSESASAIALAALVISMATFVSVAYFGWCTRDHNRRSVKPLPFVLQPDYEDRIAVIVQNNGSGPLILKAAQAVTPENRRDHLIDIIPPAPTGLLFTNFNRVEQARALRPGDQVVLLDISLSVQSPTGRTYRDILRQALGELMLELTYTDIYETRFPVYCWKLDWFSR